MKKNWKINNFDFDDNSIKQFSDTVGVSNAFAKLLLSRGITSKEEYSRFITGVDSSVNPFVLPDMDKAVRRIRRGIESGEKMLIYGDYDADGVSSVSLLYLYLKSKGANVSYYIPSRLTEGYGLSDLAVKEAAENGVTLIITVDTGITAIDEIRTASALGIDTVVTDHHECKSELPEAYANVDIKRADTPDGVCEYAGVGVALKLAEALEYDITSDKDAPERILDEYADIVAIGTVADVMSLTGENRAIVKKGLEKINSGNCRPGIKALLSIAAKKEEKVSSKTIGFIIAPRINAAGRMDSADTALELILCDDTEKCAEIAGKLCELNSKRQSEENSITTMALKMLKKGDYENDDILVLGSADWHHGVIGIVCSRISEKYKKPVILLSCDEDGIAKGSCRSVGDLNIVQAIENCSEYVIKFGGHDMAAGVTLKTEMIEPFRRAINKYVSSRRGEISLTHVNIDLVLSPRDLTLPFAHELKLLEPYGKDNSEPIFALSGARVLNVIPLSGGKHCKMILKKEGISFECIAFSFNVQSKGITVGDDISVVFTLEAKEFLGKKSVQLFLRDFCFEGYYGQWQELGEEEYESFEEGIGKAPLLPSRDDLTSEYNCLRGICGYSGGAVSYKEISKRLGGRSYLATRLVADIFEDVGLIVCEDKDCYGARISLVRMNDGEKAVIESARTYKKIESFKDEND